MAKKKAEDLDRPLVSDETWEYIDEYDDELGTLIDWKRINPIYEDTIGRQWVNPETGETEVKHDYVESDYEYVYAYHVYTQEDYDIMRMEEEQREWLFRLNSSPDRIDDVEEVQASSDEALCDLFEQLIQAQDTIQTQDDAVCELYEMILGEEG